MFPRALAEVYILLFGGRRSSVPLAQLIGRGPVCVCVCTKWCQPPDVRDRSGFQSFPPCAPLLMGQQQQQQQIGSQYNTDCSCSLRLFLSCSGIKLTIASTSSKTAEQRGEACDDVRSVLLEFQTVNKFIAPVATRIDEREK